MHVNYLLLAGCKSDLECANTEACIDRVCQNPCPFTQCGSNAYCKPRNHNGYCFCEENHHGDPYDYCEPYECLQNPDCPSALACIDLKCKDPCDCPRNSYCTVTNHVGTCICEHGFEWDRRHQNCIPSKYIYNLVYIKHVWCWKNIDIPMFDVLQPKTLYVDVDVGPHYIKPLLKAVWQL